MVSFIAICCQVQLFPMDCLKNLRALQRGGNRLEYPAATTQTKQQLKEIGQNSGHNDRVEELWWGKKRQNKPYSIIHYYIYTIIKCHSTS